MNYLSEAQKIAPYINDYNKIGESFCPYLMRVSTPNYSSTTINTDPYGFRISHKPDGSIISPYELCLSSHQSLNLCLGSSALFGVGSSTDRTTITSHLAKLGINNPINTGIRACNSTQELIAFLLLYPHIKNRLERVIIFSGINNLTLNFVGSPTLPFLNPLFNTEAQALNVNKHKSIKHLSSLLFTELLSRFKLRSTISKTLPGMPPQFHTITMLDQIKSLCHHNNIPLYFIMQPIASICEKKFSPEESLLINLLNTKDNKYLRNSLAHEFNSYLSAVENFCLENNICFLDSNKYLSNSANNWYFVDSVHLSDDGNRACAEIIYQLIQD